MTTTNMDPNEPMTEPRKRFEAIRVRAKEVKRPTHTKKANRKKGFSLIELLVVVAIILIIAAIAVPNLIKSRASASQANAASSLRGLNTAVTQYFLTYGVYPPTFEALGGPAPCTQSAATSCLMADQLTTLLTAGTMNNYSWTLTPTTNPVGFTILATPAAGNNAVRSFYLDQAGQITYSDTGTATATSPAIGN
jgi:type IV pilus assembly protein PilA